ncbi:sugar ABC transporter substrate-binding protein [Sorangium cellulosum]|uniref:Sugar ABC transporter substrate-binding protein n=1 Tax=Sorangium cellulosum TaxID=56 RepID=A0A2L0EMI7_SORCE|nr:sugar-binding protein [Sorangium cellulosum]AUX40506.1 sugar ABC transporter substrate-binding protein [Sorangium cellulosum]
MKQEKSLWKLACAAAVTLSMAWTAGCDQGGGGEVSGDKSKPETTAKVTKIAFVTNGSSDFWKIAIAGVHKYEQEAKIQVDIKIPPNGTLEEQSQILESLASQGYDAVGVSVLAPNDQVPVLNRVAEKVKLITFDSDAPKSNRLLYIGTNNYEAGKVLGNEIVKILPNGGKMAAFVGMFAVDNATQRLKGIEDVVTKHNIQIVDKREDNADRAKARANVEDIINAHPDLNVATGLWSYNGPAIVAAVEALGKKGKVVPAVFDEEDATLSGIENGTVACTVVQKPFQFGYLASKWMHDLATKGDAAMAAIPPNKMVDTGVDVINKDNVAAFKAKLAELKK